VSLVFLRSFTLTRLSRIEPRYTHSILFFLAPSPSFLSARSSRFVRFFSLSSFRHVMIVFRFITSFCNFSRFLAPFRRTMGQTIFFETNRRICVSAFSSLLASPLALTLFDRYRVVSSLVNYMRTLGEPRVGATTERQGPSVGDSVRDRMVITTSKSPVGRNVVESVED